jgi:hypothetical protein
MELLNEVILADGTNDEQQWPLTDIHSRKIKIAFRIGKSILFRSFDFTQFIIENALSTTALLIGKLSNDNAHFAKS